MTKLPAKNLKKVFAAQALLPEHHRAMSGHRRDRTRSAAGKNTGQNSLDPDDLN